MNWACQELAVRSLVIQWVSHDLPKEVHCVTNQLGYPVAQKLNRWSKTNQVKLFCTEWLAQYTV